MRLQWFNLVFPLTAMAGLLIAGCPDDESQVHQVLGQPDATTGDGSDSSTPDTDSGPDASPLPKTGLRLAHLVPGIGAKEPVDVCLRAASDSKFALPPHLKTLGYPSGMKYKDVTAYDDISAYLSRLPHGPVVIRVIHSYGPGDGEGTTDCNTTNTNDIVADIPATFPAVHLGDLLTVAVLPPEGTSTAPSIGFYFDHTASDTGKAAVRFIHAAADAGNLDFFLTDGTTETLYADIPFTHTGPTSGGYLQLDPPGAAASATIQSSSGVAYHVALSSFAPAADSVTTVFAIGNSGSYGTLVCHDQGTAAAADAGADADAGSGATSKFSNCTASP